MIERIYIPTIRRADNQVAFENLPEELQKKVVMVVESGERHLYNYDCDYLELPEYVVGCECQLAETRKFIYQQAGSIKYAVIDDDCVFWRRNAKYWTGKSNMEKSRRVADCDEYFLAFDTFDKWLNEPDIGIVGLQDLASSHPPPDKEYLDTVAVSGVYFFDGKKISGIDCLAINLEEKLTCPIRKGEDLLFLYECLSRGINIRKSIEWCFVNHSMTSKGVSISGSGPDQSDLAYDALKYIQSKFPEGVKLYEKDGIRKNRKYCKKVYKPATKSSLENFL